MPIYGPDGKPISDTAKELKLLNAKVDALNQQQLQSGFVIEYTINELNKRLLELKLEPIVIGEDFLVWAQERYEQLRKEAIAYQKGVSLEDR